MAICQSTMFSMFVAAGLVATAIDTAGGGPGAVQVISVIHDVNATADPKAFRPMIDLVNEYAPQSRVEVLERIQGGGRAGEIHILIRHRSVDYLKNAIERMRASGQWADVLEGLEQTGYSVERTELLLDRTPG